MRRLAGALLLVLLPTTAFPQEVVLRDGKRILWKSMTDGKDAIEVVTTAGEKLTIKKTDINKILPTTENIPVVLTGATMTLGKSVKTTNLLALANPDKQAISADWRVAGGVLTGATVVKDGLTHRAKYILHEEAPEEYELHMVIERAGAKGTLGIGLAAGGVQFLFAFDFGGKVSGLWFQDGKSPDRSDDSKIGTVLEDRRPRNVVFMVRKNGLLVQLDGKDYYSWTGDWSRLSLWEHQQVPKKKAIFLVAEEGEYRFRKILLVHPKDQ